MILGTWMYAVQLRIERWRTHARGAVEQGMHAPGDAARDAGLNFRIGGVFMVDGKMPVVTGVAVIICGPRLWWVRAEDVEHHEGATSETPTS